MKDEYLGGADSVYFVGNGIRINIVLISFSAKYMEWAVYVYINLLESSINIYCKIYTK
jgi:hypothetical protein